MLKKYFDWTPSDVEKWEELRSKGLGRFVLWYGIKLFAGWLFVLVGAGVLLFWIKASLETHSANFAVLLVQLLFAALVCLLGGLITALSTWALEEGIYQRMLREKTAAPKN